MATNTLNNRSAGQTIVEAFFNDIHQAINTDFVGRNVTGVPTAGQNLGTIAIPWGTVRANQMILNGQAIDPSQITAPVNRVKSGKTRTGSTQPQFLTPAGGATLTVTIDATPTVLNLDVNGTDVEVPSDIVLTGLTAAPSSQNTALVNDTEAADQHDTRLWGEPEHRKKITIDTVGTNITALVGKYAAFMLDNGSTTEYFYAYVESATVLSQIRRGFFYDSTLAPKNRIFFSNNDTITLLKMGWVFVENDGTTADVSYNNPVWSFTSPGGPATGDYWYDLQNQVWKRYDGAAFQIINRTLVGIFANSSTACVAARCEDFFANYTEENTISLEKFSTEIVKGRKLGQKVNVAGMVFDFGKSLPSWNITTDLAASTEMYDAAEQASRMYYLYLTEKGDTVISDISPYFRADLFGEYHPHNPWRCVGLAYNDGSSDIYAVSAVAYPHEDGFRAYGAATRPAVDSGGLIYPTVARLESATCLYRTDANAGATATIFWPGSYEISSCSQNTGSSMDGISYNEPSPRTGQIAEANALITQVVTGGGLGTALTRTAKFLIGDVLAPHPESITGTQGFSFSGQRVA